ncbi:MAG: sugar ABC transporter permease, partial [Clostridia bacterium]|nr:sugar ABC transporter permease [Clostridia bacterium]
MKKKTIATNGNKKNNFNGLGRRDNIDGTIMASLPFIGYILFSFFPMAFSVVISFTELHGYDFSQMRFLWEDGVWHTFDNYINLFKTEFFGISVLNSLQYTLIVPFKLALQLYIAHLLTKRVVARKFFRVAYFIPSICSTVAVSVMWNWIFEPNFGIVNTFLGYFGGPRLGLVSSAEEFMRCVWVLSIWWGGCNVILMDSALASVDTSLKEAASLDGASEFKIFWKITFPCITPTIFYHLVMNFIAA